MLMVTVVCGCAALAQVYLRRHSYSRLSLMKIRIGNNGNHHGGCQGEARKAAGSSQPQTQIHMLQDLTFRNFLVFAMSASSRVV